MPLLTGRFYSKRTSNLNKGNSSILVICVVSIVIGFSSCVHPEKLVYFPNQQDTTIRNLQRPEDASIQENDVLSITVTSLSAEASALFNAPNMQMASTSSGLGTQTGYLVGNTGTIKYPFLGEIKVSGLTIPQLADKIKTEILTKQLLLDPIVTIRQLNYHITFIGEVGRPGVYTIPSEKVNILEALGQAGDLTPYAKRDNILLIREENGVRQVKRLNLNSSNLLTSPYYYLKKNDILIAEPNKIKATSVSNQGQLISYGLTALSVLITIISLTITLSN